MVHQSMKLPIILGLTAFLFFLCLVHSTEAFVDSGPQTNPPTIRQRFLDKTLYSDQIPNAPAPAGTDQTGKLMYTSADLEANIVKLKNEVDNMQMNTPGYIKQEVSQQLFKAVSDTLPLYSYANY
jgi:hypothetical protein